MPFVIADRRRQAFVIAGLLLITLVLEGCATTPPCSSQALPVSQSVHTLNHPDGRETQVTLWQPTVPGQYPLATFSHGAFSAPERYDALLEPMAAMGLVIFAPLHIDSELLVTDQPPPPAEVWTTRKQDVAALLAAPRALRSHLNGGVSLSEAKVSAGHSYGAFGAQVAAGAAAVGDVPGDIAPGVAAVIAFSPPGVLPGFIENGAWDAMDRPQLVLTGTGDILPGFLDDWRSHKAAWEQAPPAHQWLWVGEGVDHYFGRIFGRPQREVPPQQAEFDEALVATAQFLATYVEQDMTACSGPITPRKTALASIERR